MNILAYDKLMAEKINKLFIIFLTIFFILPTFALSAQELSRIAVIPMKNNSGLPEYSTLCDTVTDTVTSVIPYLPDYTLFEATDNPQMLEIDTSNLESIKEFAAEYGYDEILYGDLTKNEQDKLLFKLQIYDLKEHDILVEQDAIAETLLDVFDTADIMTLDLLGQITDVNIGFGTIELTKTSGQGIYDVYLNDKLIRNPKKNFNKVLNGSYFLEIRQDRILGETVVYSSKFYVNEFQTSSVRFSIPGATEEELRYILIQNQDMLETAGEPENLDKFLAEIAEFQEFTNDIDYDPELVELKDTIIEELGVRASQILEDVMEEADKSYYNEDPDFQGANEIYTRISGLVNNNFTYSYADVDGQIAIQIPEEVLISESGHLYFLDRGNPYRLSSFSEGTRYIASRDLNDWDTNPDILRLTVDTGGNCFGFTPGTPAVLRYPPDLTDPTILTIPDYISDPDDPLFLAVSNENAVYLIGSSTYIVFEYEIGIEIIIERDNVLEETLRNTLSAYSGSTIGKIFFNENNILHLFLPSDSKIIQLTSLGEIINIMEFPGISPDAHVAVDTLGYYYFTIPATDTVLKYSPKGEVISRFGLSGKEDGEFSSPQGIAVNNEGTIYVADSGNNRLQILTLAAPPLLLPAVAQFGEAYSRREESSAEAVEKYQNISIDTSVLKSLVKYAVPFGLIGAAAGFSFLDGLCYRASMIGFSDYQNAATLEEVEQYKTQSQLYWALSRSSMFAGYAAMGIGSYWLADSITKSIDSKIRADRTIQYLQSFDMDKDYDVDEEKFVSLQTANIIGLTTGLLPPLAGGAAALVLSLIPDINPEISYMVAAGLIAIPPIFSHVYAGQMSWGSFVTGLIADALAITAYMFSMDIHSSTYYDNFEDPEERGERYLDDSGTRYITDYYLIGALVFRFVAGLHDFTDGWRSANEYNTYEAVTERPSPLSMQINPIINENMEAGIEFTLEF